MKYPAGEPLSFAPNVIEFYSRALALLNRERIPFLVGGAFALHWHTGILNPTKDLDLMVRPPDCDRVLKIMNDAGFRTELTFPHWLGKIFDNGAFIDIIFNSGNGMIPVDDEWFQHGVDAKLFDMTVQVCSAAELIWSKAFVMERERYDGADVLHLVRTCGSEIDWQRLLNRFGANWHVLLSHLILFHFVYPSDRAEVPKWVPQLLMRRMQAELDRPEGTSHICRGTLLSREQYLVDVDKAGYVDPRLLPRGTMSEEDIARWTAAIKERGDAIGH